MLLVRHDYTYNDWKFTHSGLVVGAPELVLGEHGRVERVPGNFVFSPQSLRGEVSAADPFGLNLVLLLSLLVVFGRETNFDRVLCFSILCVGDAWNSINFGNCCAFCQGNFSF